MYILYMEQFDKLMPKITVCIEESDDDADDEIDKITSIINENEDENAIFVKPDLKIKNVKPLIKSSTKAIEDDIPIQPKKKTRDWTHLNKARDASKKSRKASAELMKQRKIEEKEEKARLRDIKRAETAQRNRDSAKQRYRMKREVELELKEEKERKDLIKQKKTEDVNIIKQIISEDKRPTRANTGLSYLDFSMYMNQYRRESQMIKEKESFKPIEKPPIAPPPKQDRHSPGYFNPHANRKVDINSLF